MSQAQPLKIPLKATFKDGDGDIVTMDKLPPSEDGKNILTVRHCMIAALTAEFQQDQDRMNPMDLVNDKIKRFDLYNRLLGSENEETLELAPELAAYMKPRIARSFGIIVAGPLMMYLDGKNPS